MLTFFVASHAAAETIDFEGLARGEIVNDQFVALGVTIFGEHDDEPGTDLAVTFDTMFDGRVDSELRDLRGPRFAGGNRRQTVFGNILILDEDRDDDKYDRGYRDDHRDEWRHSKSRDDDWHYADGHDDRWRHSDDHDDRWYASDDHDDDWRHSDDRDDDWHHSDDRDDDWHHSDDRDDDGHHPGRRDDDDDHGVIGLIFATPVVDFALDVIGADPPGRRGGITFFSSGDEATVSFAEIADADPSIEFTENSANHIQTISAFDLGFATIDEVHISLDGVGGIDNITFNAVPEPSTALMICSGIVGIFGRRRAEKRRARASPLK